MAYQCMQRGCKSSATHTVKLEIPPTNWAFHEHECLEMYCGLRLCLEHAKEAEVDDMLSDDFKQDITATFRSEDGKNGPDFNRTRVTPVSLDDPFFIMAMRQENVTIH